MSLSLVDILAGVEEAQATQPAVVEGSKVEQSGVLTTEVRVVPYNALADPQADTFLPWMWKRMQEDDLVDYYFPGQKDTGFGAFVRLFSGDANVALFVIEREGEDWESRIPGFITWTASRMGVSDVLIAGFIFFRKSLTRPGSSGLLAPTCTQSLVSAPVCTRQPFATTSELA